MKFEDFKKSFYSRVTDLSLFDAGEINFLKTVLDGLKVDYVSRGNVRVIILRSNAYISFYFFTLRLMKGVSSLASILKHPSRKSARNLVIDPAGRIVETSSGIKSQYFSNILPQLQGGYFMVGEGTKQGADQIHAVVGDYNLYYAAGAGGLTPGEITVLEKLRLVYRKIEAGRIFTATELKNIAIAFQQFFIRYRIWSRIADHTNIETAYLWPHYHREGCIYALRERGIKIIELQHGLIAPQDIFYVLPDAVKPVSRRALFADEIWVYGEFWKDQLLKGAGYTAEQIKVKGFFPLSVTPTAEKLKSFADKYAGKKIVLVTTQTFLSEYFCSYIQFLAGEITEEYMILVKLHPAEHVKDYARLGDLKNVAIIHESLDLLFRFASINISIYSTTLFDGIRYGVPGYAIWHERFADYISFFRETGIIRVIQPNENPLNLETAPEHDASYFYQSFQTDGSIA